MRHLANGLLLATLLLGSASVLHAELALFVNEQSKFVISGTGEQIPGVDIVSPSGSLVPAVTAEPFQFLLTNTPDQIAFGVLGTKVAIDGEVELSAGWDPFGEMDVKYDLGVGTRTPLPPEAYQGMRPVRLSLGEDLKFVLQGTGQKLQSLELQSASGSLLPGANPAPFAQYGANTTNQISMSSPGSNVTLDGSVTLSSGWSRDIAVRDVNYQYQLDAEPIASGPFNMSNSAYPPEPPTSRITVTLDDSDRFVLTGRGQELRTLDFRSPSGSLLPGDAAAPFAQFATNTADHVSLESPGSRVTIDGSITLSAEWNRNVAGKDVDYEYEQDLLPGTQGPYSVSASAYPELPPNTPLIVTLSNTSRLVLNGSGHRLTSIDFESPTGSLLPAESASPFATLDSNTSEHIALASLGNAVTVRGRVELAAGWNVLGEKDVSYRYDFDGAPELEGPYPLSDSTYPGGPPPVNITLSEDDFRFVIHGQDTNLVGIDFRSASGSMDPGNNPAPFEFMLAGTAEQVAMGVLGGSVAIDGSAKLDAGWNFLSGQRDVVFYVGIPGQTDPVGPFQLLNSTYDVHGDGTLPEVSVDDSGDISLDGFDTVVKSVRILSPGGWLIPIGDPSPFFLVETNTPNEIVLMSEEGVATTELLQLPIQWAVRGEQDLAITIETLTAELGPFVLPASAYANAVPEPSTWGLASLAGVVITFAPRRRNRMARREVGRIGPSETNSAVRSQRTTDG